MVDSRGPAINSRERSGGSRLCVVFSIDAIAATDVGTLILTVRSVAWLFDVRLAAFFAGPSRRLVASADLFRLERRSLLLEGLRSSVSRHSVRTTADRSDQFPEEAERSDDAGRVVREFE